MSKQVDQVEEMNDLHVELGRKAAQLAINVLDTIDLMDMPLPSVVALLRFGVELERKALLGSEQEEDDVDPFEALSKALVGGSDKKDGG